MPEKLEKLTAQRAEKEQGGQTLICDDSNIHVEENRADNHKSRFDPKKIAIIGPTAPFRGGIAHYTTLLFKHLKNRHEVRFFAFKRQYPGWLFPGKTDIDPSREAFSAPGVERTLDSLNPLTWIGTARKIIRSRCDLLIIPWWVSFWAPPFLTILALVKRRTRAKILFVCHNVVAHEARFFDRALTHMVLRFGDFFIVHSKEDEANLRAMLPRAVIHRRFHPTYDAFNRGTAAPKDCRRALGVQSPVLLFFGFVRDYKGLKHLLAAMPKILAKISVTLLIVGEFWKDKETYLKQINDLGINGRVRIIDEYVPNEDVGRYFNAADLVVQPYVSATGSGVVQLAFGFHKPVVVTAVGSLPEIVEDGKAGFVVPPGDASAIAAAVIRFFEENRAEEFSENIRKQQHRFSWDHLVDSIERLGKGWGSNLDL